ncbi:hypothetical protein CAOG_05277 [Capsaspora owczarzaki ATCC 30864]|uniref:Uncharacterized protein n=1 Tax=Capsaspora owczarzaki (strain ATCC 30864) TaxID=595528 RepID=A0A0D2X3P4_CAPO3|nr:hypothetical protein CAOG_05277 [Capsaspora owczarzaki ATCC 30864]KJE94664.1 hypothetical protein CAOG_005277 [Capsaspora owczarzaki ATCC 30864]|eukprot:XP_004346962.1 hypothetical protein CAOG_05277 [Capsaspora owczarzaki ATCC 30864]
MSSGSGSLKRPPPSAGGSQRSTPTGTPRPSQTASPASTSTMPSASSSSSASSSGPASAIAVAQFAAARAREIQTMLHALNEPVNGGGGRRVFQTLPRHMRRRAMSHNVKRVPKRSRSAAQRETEAIARGGGGQQANNAGDGLSAKGLPVAMAAESATTVRVDKIQRETGRSVSKRARKRIYARIRRTIQAVKRPTRMRRRIAANARHRHLLKRARAKGWLETHVWHAKRMKMADQWGFRLALRSAQRGMRATHRATLHSVTAHDASYHGIIELAGPFQELLSVLGAVSHPTDPSAADNTASPALTGAVAGDAMLFAPHSYPLGVIGPFSFLWRPVERNNHATSNTAAMDTREDSSSCNTTTTTTEDRALWMWFHPACFHAALLALRQAVKSSQSRNVLVLDRRKEIVQFQLTGPWSHALLNEILDIRDGLILPEQIRSLLDRRDRHRRHPRRRLGSTNVPASSEGGIASTSTVTREKSTATDHDEFTSDEEEASGSDDDAEDTDDDDDDDDDARAQKRKVSGTTTVTTSSTVQTTGTIATASTTNDWHARQQRRRITSLQRWEQQQNDRAARKAQRQLAKQNRYVPQHSAKRRAVEDPLSGEPRRASSKPTFQRRLALKQRMKQLPPSALWQPYSLTSNIVWASLATLHNAAALPPRTVFALDVHDPRTVHRSTMRRAVHVEERRAAHANPSNIANVARGIQALNSSTFNQLLQHQQQQQQQQRGHQDVNNPDLALSYNGGASLLWDKVSRTFVQDHQVSERELHERRQQYLLPNKATIHSEEDTPIPLILVQTPGSSGSSAQFVNHVRNASTQASSAPSSSIPKTLRAKLEKQRRLQLERQTQAQGSRQQQPKKPAVSAALQRAVAGARTCDRLQQAAVTKSLIRQALSGPAIGYASGYSFFAPAKFGSAFWRSLTYAGARAIGQEDLERTALESGDLQFPIDFPDTVAHRALARQRAMALSAKHSRYPKAKRVNYLRIGTPSPFYAAWTWLLAVWERRASSQQVDALVGSDYDASSAVFVVDQARSNAIHPRTFAGRKAAQQRAAAQQPTDTNSDGQTLRKRIISTALGGIDNFSYFVLRDRVALEILDQALGLSRKSSASSTSGSLDKLKAGPVHSILVCIKIKMLSKGVPSYNAMICMPTGADCAELATSLDFAGPVEGKHTASDLSTPSVRGNIAAAGRTVTSTREIMGFVTTGGYSFTRASGFGVAFCTLASLLELASSRALRDPMPFILVRNPRSRQYRVAMFSILDS